MSAFSGTVAGWFGVLALALVGCAPAPATNDLPTGPYAGSARCESCHTREYAAWEDSGHALAAGPPAGPAYDGTVYLASLTGTFRASAAAVTFSPAEGTAALPVALTIGGRAMQQPLVATERGALQTLPFAWDRARGEWFDLFPHAPDPGDLDHWRGSHMTANSQCLACHVTGYARGYDASSGEFHSRWEEPGVGCEACHGPGGDHVRARAAGRSDRYDALSPRTAAHEICASCHGLRLEQAEGYGVGAPLADFFRFDALDTDQFHADGRVAGEVFQWVSFGLSRKAARGVVCRDCHEPHGTAPRAAGAALCSQCHGPDYGRPTHTHHAIGSAGADCRACHMPETVFMQRDPRRDHAFSSPDPVLSAVVGSPDPCLGCHADRGMGAIVNAFEGWFPENDSRIRRRQVATALFGAKGREPTARPVLLDLLRGDLDPIRHASAVRLLGGYPPDDATTAALVAATTHDDALVRAGAVAGLGLRQGSPLPAAAFAAIETATHDPRRLVRAEAGFAWPSGDAPVPPSAAAAREDWVAGQQLNGDLCEARYNLALFSDRLGDHVKARTEYETVVARCPSFAPARQNLGMLLLDAGEIDSARAAFGAVLEAAPALPAAHFGLALVAARRDDWVSSARELETALAEDPALAGARLHLGRAYLQLSRDAEARAEFERAVDDPGSRRPALRELVLIATRAHDDAALARWLPLSLGLDPAMVHEPALQGVLPAQGATSNESAPAPLPAE